MRKAACDAAVIVAALALANCNETPLTNTEIDHLASRLGVSECRFGQSFTLASTNPYYPLHVGDEWLLEGEEDGSLVRLQVEVLNETEVVGGVTTRVVQETEWVDDELLEVSRNFFAANGDATVCYFGEDVDIYESGEIVSHEGAWRADEQDNFPGIIMPAVPKPGVHYLMEGAPGTAQDVGLVVGSGRTVTPAGTFTETVRIRESGGDPGDFDFKVFAKNIGIIIDGPLSLVSYSVTGQ
jgi:hypothetical protein